MKPPWLLTMPLTVESPRPVPLSGPLVVKNGSKMRSRISGGMPVPVSVTRHTTYWPGLASGTALRQLPAALGDVYTPAKHAAVVSDVTEATAELHQLACPDHPGSAQTATTVDHNVLALAQQLPEAHARIDPQVFKVFVRNAHVTNREVMPLQSMCQASLMKERRRYLHALQFLVLHESYECLGIKGFNLLQVEIQIPIP